MPGAAAAADRGRGPDPVARRVRRRARRRRAAGAASRARAPGAAPATRPGRLRRLRAVTVPTRTTRTPGRCTRAKRHRSLPAPAAVPPAGYRRSAVHRSAVPAAATGAEARRQPRHADRRRRARARRGRGRVVWAVGLRKSPATTAAGGGEHADRARRPRRPAGAVLKPVSDSTFNIYGSPPGDTEDQRRRRSAIDGSLSTAWATVLLHRQPELRRPEAGHRAAASTWASTVKLSQVEVLFGSQAAPRRRSTSATPAADVQDRAEQLHPGRPVGIGLRGPHLPVSSQRHRPLRADLAHQPAATCRRPPGCCRGTVPGLVYNVVVRGSPVSGSLLTARGSPMSGPASRRAVGRRTRCAGTSPGTPTAFGLLFKRHKDRLWAVALRITCDPDDAADALQDAMISAFRRAEDFRGESAVTTWLHRIVVNASLDLLRRRAARSRQLVGRPGRAESMLEPRTPAAARRWPSRRPGQARGCAWRAAATRRTPSTPGWTSTRRCGCCRRRSAPPWSWSTCSATRSPRRP